MAGDILDHHDGIIDHKTRGNGQGHQSQVIKAITQEQHDHKSANNGQGHHHRGDKGRSQGAQKHKGHQNH